MAAAKVDIKFSRKTKSFAKFDVTFQQVVFAQLLALGYNKAEAAWAVYYKFDKTVSNAQCEKMATAKLEVLGVKAMLEHFKSQTSEPEAQASQSLDALIAQRISETGSMDKESTAMEILRIAKLMPDGKEKAELMMKYADIMGFKKADSQDAQVRHTMFYLPATCDKCPVRRWVQDNYPDALRSRKTPDK